MSRSANATINCPACKKPNDGGMNFCIFCGTVINQSTAKRADRTCVSCGRFDELNVNFCIHCGANTSQAVTHDSIEMGQLSSPRETKHTPVMQTRPPAAQSVTRNRVKAVSAQVAQDRMRAKKDPAKRPVNNLVFVAAGSVIGLALAALSFQSGLLVQAARFCLPSQGLAIYTEVPGMTVLIEGPKGKDFTLGETGQSGTLAINDLTPGNGYHLRMEGRGFETVYFPPFSIYANNVSVLGYPKKVALPPRHI